MPDFSRPIPLAHYALLAVAVLGCFFLGIGGFPLFDLDEGAFSEATREMLASGNYLSTTLNGEPRYDKPILIYWLQATSASLFGINEFAFRLPSALAGSGWVVLTYLFVRRAASARQALAAGIITASALAVSIIVKVATADALLNLLISATLFSAYLFLRFHDRKYLYLAFAAMGLGFLTKGPVAVIIPGVVTFLYSALRKDIRGWLTLALNGRGIALFFAIAAPWYVTQYLVEGDGFFRGFFLKHNVERPLDVVVAERGEGRKPLPELLEKGRVLGDKELFGGLGVVFYILFEVEKGRVRHLFDCPGPFLKRFRYLGESAVAGSVYAVFLEKRQEKD